MGGSGTTTIAAGGTLTMSGSTTKYVAGRTLSNSGIIIQAGSGSLYSNGGTNIVNNQLGATYDLQGDAGMTYSAAAGTFNNAGLFKKSAGSGTSNAIWFFNNTGTVEVQSGTFSLGSGGTHSGTFDVSAGATLGFFAGTQNLNAGTSFPGAGALAFTGGTVNMNIPFSPTVPVTLSGGAVLNLTGDNSFAVLDWFGGTLGGSGTTTIAAGGTLTMSGSGIKILANRTLSNSGTIVQTGSGSLYANGGTNILNNQLGATYDLQGDAGMTYSAGPGTFNNAGLFKKSAGSGTSNPIWVFNNTGTVEVQSGTLTLGNSGTHSGTFNVSAGATLGFGGGTHNINAGTSFPGAGALAFTGAVVNMNIPFSPTVPVTLSNGGVLTLSGDNSFSALTWTSGQLVGTGTTTNAAGATLAMSGSNPKYLSRTLNNVGLVALSGTGAFYGNVSAPAVINNQAGATFDVQSDASVLTFNSPVPVFNNNSGAIFQKSAGNAASNVDWVFNNSGNVNVQSGTLAFNRGLTVSGATALFDIGANHNATVTTVTLDGGGSITGTGTSGVTATASFAMKSGAVGAILKGTGIPLNKTTAGTATLTGANTYTGATTIQQGTLSAATVAVSAGASALGNAASAVVLGDATNKGTLA